MSKEPTLRPGELTPNWLGVKGSDRLSVRIQGYQFPQVEATADDPYDANWLYIQGRLETRTTNWKFVDACLFTWECEELIEWLRKFPEVETLEFMEPLFRFEADPDHKRLIRVRLLGESFPPDGDPEEQWIGGYELFLNIGEEQRERFIQTLTYDLERYPKRG